jgi:methionyl aminopeptidase
MINLEKYYLAASKCTELHQRVCCFLKEGMKLTDLDSFLKKNFLDLKCKSAFYNYRRGILTFPCQACYSINDCIVHGTAGCYDKPLKTSDLIKIDIGVIDNGIISDLGWTYALKEKTENSEKLIRAGKESLNKGIEKIKFGKPILDFALTVQNCVETEYGLHIIRGLGGHYFGKSLHQPPFIPNCGDILISDVFSEGTIAVEPMIGLTTGRTISKGWPIYTIDSSLSSHFEHNLAIFKDKTVLLSEKMNELPEIIG